MLYTRVQSSRPQEYLMKGNSLKILAHSKHQNSVFYLNDFQTLIYAQWESIFAFGRKAFFCLPQHIMNIE